MPATRRAPGTSPRAVGHAYQHQPPTGPQRRAVNFEDSIDSDPMLRSISSPQSRPAATLSPTTTTTNRLGGAKASAHNGSSAHSTPNTRSISFCPEDVQPTMSLPAAAGLNNSSNNYSEEGSDAVLSDKGDPVSDNSNLSASNNSSMSTNATDQSAARQRRVGTSTLRCGGLKVRVPFTFFTFAAMAVPIAFLVAVMVADLAATTHELHVVAEHKHFASEVGLCCTALMAERATAGPWLVNGTAAEWAPLAAARATVDDHCGAQLVVDLQQLVHESSAAPGYVWAQETTRHIALLRGLSVWRDRVDDRSADGTELRAFVTDGITATSEMLTRVADGLDQFSRAFSELVLLVSTRSHIGLARDVGQKLVLLDAAARNATAAATAATATTTAAPLNTQQASNATANATAAAAATAPTTTNAGNPDAGAAAASLLYGTIVEYRSARAEARLSYVHTVGMADPTLRAKVDGWAATPAEAAMWYALFAVGDTGVAAGGIDDAAAWLGAIAAGLAGLEDIEARHLARIHHATAAKARVRDSGLILGFGVVLCLLAAGLLAARQSRVRQQLEEQVVRIEKTKVAVSAFVPRFFLQKMGYTSIIQVTAGDATNVALAMLFSDIRRFTTVSEGMSSADLFDWVQGYFRRMTTIVDNRKGNVNQFVGDALFAVFSMSHDAIQCAVDMHTDVEQLNVLRRRVDQKTTPIEVGVGIHHDVVALGILGDDKRHTCTAISASVNLASRLEGLTKQLGCKIIASEAAVEQLTAEQAAATRKRCLGAVQVKGSQAGVVVYDVFHADATAAQQYKESTRDAFEVVARLCHTRGAADPFVARVREALRGYVREARSFAAGSGCDLQGSSPDVTPNGTGAATNSVDSISAAPVDLERSHVKPAALYSVSVPTVSRGDATAGAVVLPLPPRRDLHRPPHSVVSSPDAPSTTTGHTAVVSSPDEDGLVSPTPPARAHDSCDEHLADILRGLARYSYRDVALELFATEADGSGRHSFSDK